MPAPLPLKAPPPAILNRTPAKDSVVIFRQPDPRLLQGAIIKVPPAHIGHQGTVPKSAMVRSEPQDLRSDVIPVKPPPPPVQEERERRARADFLALRSNTIPVKPPPPPIQTTALLQEERVRRALMENDMAMHIPAATQAIRGGLPGPARHSPPALPIEEWNQDAARRAWHELVTTPPLLSPPAKKVVPQSSAASSSGEVPLYKAIFPRTPCRFSRWPLHRSTRPTRSCLKSTMKPKLPVELHPVVVDPAGDSTSEAGAPLEGEEKQDMLDFMESDGDFRSSSRQPQATMVIPPAFDLTHVSYTHSSSAKGFRRHLFVNLEDILARPFLQNYAGDWPPEELGAQRYASCQRCFSEVEWKHVFLDSNLRCYCILCQEVLIEEGSMELPATAGRGWDDIIEEGIPAGEHITGAPWNQSRDLRERLWQQLWSVPAWRLGNP